MIRSGRDDEASLVYLVGRVHQGIRREMRIRLASHQLSVQEFTALSVLQARPGLSNAQLARRSLVTPQSMIEIVAKLERRGLVVREVDPDHGRVLRTALTGAGGAVLARAAPAIDELQDEVFDGVSERNRQILQRAMLSAMRTLSRPRSD